MQEKLLFYLSAFIGFAKENNISSDKLADWMVQKYEDSGMFNISEQPNIHSLIKATVDGRNNLYKEVATKTVEHKTTITSKIWYDNENINFYIFDVNPEEVQSYGSSLITKYLKKFDLKVSAKIENNTEVITIGSNDGI